MANDKEIDCKQFWSRNTKNEQLALEILWDEFQYGAQKTGL